MQMPSEVYGHQFNVKENKILLSMEKKQQI